MLTGICKIMSFWTILSSRYFQICVFVLSQHLCMSFSLWYIQSVNVRMFVCTLIIWITYYSYSLLVDYKSILYSWSISYISLTDPGKDAPCARPLKYDDISLFSWKLNNIKMPTKISDRFSRYLHDTAYNKLDKHRQN